MSDGYEDTIGFNDKHGYTVRAALKEYLTMLRHAASGLQGQYDVIKDKPDACAVQNQSRITTQGLRLAAEQVSSAAARAERALEAYQDLIENAQEARG